MSISRCAPGSGCTAARRHPSSLIYVKSPPPLNRRRRSQNRSDDARPDPASRDPKFRGWAPPSDGKNGEKNKRAMAHKSNGKKQRKADLSLRPDERRDPPDVEKLLADLRRVQPVGRPRKQPSPV